MTARDAHILSHSKSLTAIDAHIVSCSKSQTTKEAHIVSRSKSQAARDAHILSRSRPPSSWPLVAISRMACRRHLISSVGHSVSEEKKAAMPPDTAFLNGLSSSTDFVAVSQDAIS